MTQPEAELREPELLWNRQLNAMDWSSRASTGAPHHMVYQGWRPEGVTRTMLRSTTTASIARCGRPTRRRPCWSASTRDLRVASIAELGVDDFPTSPIFVPRDPRRRFEPGGHDGYVVVPMLNDSGFRIECYDAAAVGKGSLATLACGSATVPFLLHPPGSRAPSLRPTSRATASRASSTASASCPMISPLRRAKWRASR